MGRSFWCFAHGSDADGWEALCVDLDIAVEGRSFDDVKHILESAIRSYCADALNESPKDRDRLLSRRAPLYVRLGCWLRLAGNALRPRSSNRDLKAGFELPCPA